MIKFPIGLECMNIMTARLLLAGTKYAQAKLVLAVPPLYTVHCGLYTCAGATRDEYFQLPTTRLMQLQKAAIAISACFVNPGSNHHHHLYWSNSQYI